MKTWTAAENRKSFERFSTLWKGGYFEGDPLDPMGRNGYNRLGYMSVLHATYLCCIKPWVNEDSVVLEIGAGRGAWTRTMLHAREVAVLESVDAEHSRFWEYLGRHENVHYHKVTDLSCSVVPDNHFTFFFTFGCFCHLPSAAVVEYMTNVRLKLRPGSHGFMMVADFRKYNHAVENLSRYADTRACHVRRFAPIRWLWEIMWRTAWPYNLRPMPIGDSEASGAWHDFGTDEACKMLEELGYRIVDPDCGVNHRDPVIHFVRP
jgi:phospholipid N-methyltransferase